MAGFAVYTLVRFRQPPGTDDARREPPQVYGSTQIELAWTVVPLLIVVVLFLATARYIYGIERRAAPPEALEVTVVGHQWWWEIRYPDLGIVTANELHVPVSDPASPTPTFLTLESADVVHSFWVPQLAGKMDVIPNKTNRMWIDPRDSGHLRRPVRRVLRPPARRDAAPASSCTPRTSSIAGWRPSRRPSATTLPSGPGRELFLSLACINCHTVRGTPANGMFGPDLTHLMSRRTIAAGAAREHARRTSAPGSTIPASLKPGVAHAGHEALAATSWTS